MPLTALIFTKSHNCPLHYAEICHNQLRPTRSSNIDSTNTYSLTLFVTNFCQNLHAHSPLISFRPVAPHSPCPKVSTKPHDTANLLALTLSDRQSLSAAPCLLSTENCRSCRQHNKKYCEDYHVYSVRCLQYVLHCHVNSVLVYTMLHLRYIYFAISTLCVYITSRLRRVMSTEH